MRGRQLEIALESHLTPQAWRAVVAEFDVVLNCVGILRPVANATYDRIHKLAPQACVGTPTRFVHVSALGLQATDRSGFLTSKRFGEQAVQASDCDWILVRPSLLDGVGGYGAAWLRGVAKLPVFIKPADAVGQIAAFAVDELGAALATLCIESADRLDLARSRIFELGGVRTFTFEEYIRGLRRHYSPTRAHMLVAPGWLARLAAHLCDLFHFTPFSFGHWELLRKDNVPTPNRLPQLLGRAPRSVVGPMGDP